MVEQKVSEMLMLASKRELKTLSGAFRVKEPKLGLTLCIQEIVKKPFAKQSHE